MMIFHSLILLIAGICYLLKNFFGYSPFAINLINDFIALPFILLLLNKAMKLIYENRFHFNLTHALSAALAATLLFEVIFPLYNKEMTSDYTDSLLYLIGAIGYYVLYQLRSTKEHS